MSKHRSNSRYIFYTLLSVLGLLFSFIGHRVIVNAKDSTQNHGLHVYFNFYDSESGDINRTRGLYSREADAVCVGNYLEAQINEWPAIYDLQEVEGYPKVLINYGDVSGREKDITEFCRYEPESGFIQIPLEYKDEYLTVKSVMSDSSTAYQQLVPDVYKINKTVTRPMMRKPSDPTLFEVITGSSNDTTAASDISGYNVGDQIPVLGAFIQTLNLREDPGLYDQTGTAAYRGYEGERIGYAISIDCGTSHSAFFNIGAGGTNGTGQFPNGNGYSPVDYASRNWMYARCITDDSNYFDGNPMCTGGKIYITDKAADGTLTCWIEVYASGPKGEAAQDVGMYFRLHPPAEPPDETPVEPPVEPPVVTPVEPPAEIPDDSRNLTIQKTIQRSDIWWAHGEPTFLFTVSGTDTKGVTHQYQRVITFTPDNVSDLFAADGSVTLSTKLENIPSGTYSIQEQRVSRFALVDVTAQTDNITISKSNSEKAFGDIQPIRAFVSADLTQKDGIVTFFNRKITWDYFSHTDIVINTFTIQKG